MDIKILEEMRLSWHKLMGTNKEEKLSDQYQCTTMDGKTLNVMGTDLAVGAEIYEIDAEGNQTILADGSYQITDGRMIEVVTGKIESIEAPEPETQDMETEVPAQETEMDVNTDVASLKSEVEALKTAIADIQAKMDEMMNMSKDGMDATAKMQEQIVKLSNMPAEKPIKIENTMLQSTTNESGYVYDKDRILEIKRKLINNR